MNKITSYFAVSDGTVYNQSCYWRDEYEEQIRYWIRRDYDWSRGDYVVNVLDFDEVVRAEKHAFKAAILGLNRWMKVRRVRPALQCPVKRDLIRLLSVSRTDFYQKLAARKAEQDLGRDIYDFCINRHM